MNNIFIGQPVPFRESQLTNQTGLSLNVNTLVWACEYVFRGSRGISDGSESLRPIVSDNYKRIDRTNINTLEMDFLQSLGLLYDVPGPDVYIQWSYGNLLYAEANGAFSQQPAVNPYQTLAKILVEWTLPGRLWLLQSTPDLSKDIELALHMEREAAEVKAELEELRTLFRS
jgi:hypothetical protein